LNSEEQVAEINFTAFTGNTAVDNILNYKINTARNLGIEVNYHIERSEIKIPDVDISRVLGNLFDNAIEACENINLPQKNIEIKIYKRKVYRCIYISNPITESVKKNNPNLISTKKEKGKHSFGIKSIRSIVEKYEGFFNFYEENNRIFFEVLLAEINL
jgi:sensor histidine kinase YesM